MQDIELLKLSESLLYNTKTGKPTNDIEIELGKIGIDRLIFGLSTDEAKKTFWINVYNSWYQILSNREKLKNPKIFSIKKIHISGIDFSLDDIEHGILRKYRWKYSMGYFPNIFTNKLIKKMAVSKIDYRIHFALNCGAKSCPPIAFYTFTNLNKQLDLATKSFLNSETDFDDTKREISVTKIMQWFIADFGGKRGIISIIKNVLGRDVETYKIKFKPYNWEESLHNFSD